MWLGYEVGRLLKFQFIINDWEKRKKLSKSLVSARIQTINPQISLPYCENVTSINWKVSGNHHMGSSMAKEWTWSWIERNWATTATFFGSEHATEMRLLWEWELKEERRGWVGFLEDSFLLIKWKVAFWHTSLLNYDHRHTLSPWV